VPKGGRLEGDELGDKSVSLERYGFLMRRFDGQAFVLVCGRSLDSCIVALGSRNPFCAGSRSVGLH
jgi:hypothetical protein